jgi:hypothetical protein
MQGGLGEAHVVISVVAQGWNKAVYDGAHDSGSSRCDSDDA